MWNVLANILVNSFAVIVTAYFLPWVEVLWFMTAIIVSIVFWIINTFIRPIILLLTLPINILTIWLFTLVINAWIVLFVSIIIENFNVNWFWTALFFSIVLWIVNSLLYLVFWED